MYTRSRQSQGYSNTRNQNNPTLNYQGQNTFNQGGFQGSQPSPNQQSNYKQGNAQNVQTFKQQPQQQQVTSRNLQQGKPPQPQQQQQQQQQQIKPPQQPISSQIQPQSQPQPQPVPQPQPQQQSQPQSQAQLQSPVQPQRLKPILKQTSHTQQQATPTVQNSPTPTSQPPIPAPTSVTTNSNPTPPVTNNASDAKNDNQVPENTDVEMQDQQPRWRRKVPGFRVNKRLKRLRLNQRLRKTLQPKNAIMVLNEMKAGVQFTFPETQGMPNSLYLVHAELDGKTYVGQGLSKPLARQNAAENALKALLLEKMTAASLKARIDAETDGMINQLTDSSNVSKDDSNEEGATPMDTNVDESDEIPWSSLASFALYKLFLEWHNQGTSVPVSRPGLPSPVKGVKKEIAHVPKTPVQKELPSNATNIHPVMLLNQMRPGLTYVELNRVGNPPNTMFTLAVEIDGVEYAGTAKNKKDAKKIAAKSALLALYGLNYPEENKAILQELALA
ncbi:uncharacterized protein LOC144475524 [Augochlora pura]